MSYLAFRLSTHAGLCNLSPLLVLVFFVVGLLLVPTGFWTAAACLAPKLDPVTQVWLAGFAFLFVGLIIVLIPGSPPSAIEIPLWPFRAFLLIRRAQGVHVGVCSD